MDIIQQVADLIKQKEMAQQQPMALGAQAATVLPPGPATTLGGQAADFNPLEERMQPIQRPDPEMQAAALRYITAMQKPQFTG
jgi:hypothetical protein